MKLSQEQLEEFNTNGFLILKNFASKDLANNILKKAKEHLERKQDRKSVV